VRDPPHGRSDGTPFAARAGMTEDESAIRDLVDTWSTATTDRDRDTVLSLMADDVVFLVPGQKPFGKKEFAEAFDNLRSIGIESKSKIEELEVIGDWAFMRNHLSMTVTPEGGGAQTRRSGYTLTIFRREANRRWVLYRDANLVSE
jgi:uncharacterized protein (TIGR02246 family)